MFCQSLVSGSFSQASALLHRLLKNRFLKFRHCLVIFVIIWIVTLLLSFKYRESVSDFVTLTQRLYKPHSHFYGSCSHHTCFSIESCEYEYPNERPGRIRVFVYPDLLFLDGNNNHISYHGSENFRELLNAVNTSEYAVHDPEKACLFVSAMNFDNSQSLSSSELLKMFLSFPWMNNYRNHLVFALEDSHAFDTKRFNLQRFPGMIAGSGFQKPDYRSTYDISLPIISSFQPDAATFSERQYLIAIVQNQFSVSLKSDIDRLLQQPREVNDELPKSIIVHTNDQSEPFLVYRSRDLSCKRISLAYETVLSSSLFCLIDQIQAPNTLLFDAMKAGCIPVILSSDTILPFSEKLDWTKCSLSVPKGHLDNLFDVISSHSTDEITYLRRHVNFFYSKYMSSLGAIAKTTLDIINSRVFPHYAKSYNEWNDPSSSLQEVPSEVSFPSNGDAICNGYALIVATKSHIKYLVPLLSRISQSRYMQEAYIIWLGEPDSLASCRFFSQTVTAFCLIINREPYFQPSFCY
uniref:Exostosin domain-containing protein n=2 Tax=Mesocestoides corti TaxID=53468 RepID=A0A5K3FMR0_MESCO